MCFKGAHSWRNPPALHKMFIPAMTNLNMNMHLWIIFNAYLAWMQTLLIVCLRVHALPLHLESACFCIALCQWCAIRAAHARTGRRSVPLPTDPAVNSWTCEERGLPQPLGLRERHRQRESQKSGKWCLRQCYIRSSDVV